MIRPRAFLDRIKIELTEEIEEEECLGGYQNGQCVFYSQDVPELAEKSWRTEVSSLLVMESRRIHTFRFEKIPHLENQWKLTLRLNSDE